MATSRGREFVLVASLLGAVAWVLQHRARSWFEGEGQWSGGTGEPVALADETVRHAVWDEPRAFGGAEPGLTRLAFAPDGHTVVFAAGERGLNAELYVAELRGGELHAAVPIAIVNSAADDVAPAFSGTHLYFASDREGGAGGLDLWRAEWSGEGFGTPASMPVELQSAADDTDPAPTADDERVVFATNRGGDFDLWVADSMPSADGAWTLARLDAACSPRDEREPCFTSGGRALAFASNRQGSFALLRTTRVKDAWSVPRALLETPEAVADRAPCFDTTGFELAFLRGTAGGAAELVRARSREVFELPGRSWTWFDTAVVASLFLLALSAWLAKRWPALELIYKCMLVSVLLHLLLLFLFQYFFLEGGASAPRNEERRRVRYVPSEQPSALRERAGELDVARLQAAEAVPERAELASELERTMATTTTPLVAVEAEAARAPERAAVDAEPSSTMPLSPVAVESPSDARRAPTAPARELELAATSSPNGAREEPAPQRADLGAVASSPAPSSANALALRAPEGEPSTSPERSAAEPRAGVAPSTSRVDVERPAERTEARGEAPAELALAPSPSSPSRAETSTPERATLAPDGAVAGAAQRGPATSGALVAAPGTEAAAAPERARSEHGPAGSERAVSSSVAIETPREALQSRSGARPELALEPGVSLARGDAAVARPERALDEGPASGAEDRAAPSVARTSVAAAPSPVSFDAPTRAAVDARVSGAAPRSETAVASPAEERSTDDRRGRSTAAPQLELGSAPAGVARAVPPGPERGAIAAPDGRAERGAPQPGAFELARPSASQGSEALPSRGLVDAPAEARAPRVAVETDEAPAPRGANTSTRTPDVLDGLVPAERRTEPTLATPQPAELAPAAASPDRARTSELSPLAKAPEVVESAPPAIERERWDHTPYENRSAENKARAIELHGGDEKTEEAVARGLAYLASVQQRGGHWGRSDARDPKYGQVSVGKTGLALLAFLGAGHTQSSGTPYSSTVARALAFLVEAQDSESGHLGEGDAYSHGIATYALAECLAMTGDAALRPPIEKAVARILAAQDRNRDPRLFGGWSYFYADGHAYDRWPRTAITAWQVMALESARLSGIEVPDATFDAAREFLLAAQKADAGHFLYSHDPERLADRYSTLPASTPAGMFALSLLGSELSGDEWGGMRRFVLQRRPNGYRYANDDEFVFRGTGNLYFWYYGTLAMFRAGGASWKTWNEGMKETLVPAQAEDGSWEPIDPYARYARDDARDKSYTTALCVLSLEVYYRYYLPLLKVK